MSQEESVQHTISETRKAKTPEEYSAAILKHFRKFIKPTKPVPKEDPSLIFDGNLAF